MALADELKQEAYDILRKKWETRDGTQVPDTDDVKLGNEAVRLDATVLYADLAESTKLVDQQTWMFAAEMYKIYLYCASRIIRAEGGEITAFDGDRVMGIFIGDGKNSSAAKCGLHINWCVRKLINPLVQEFYKRPDFELKQVVGVDTSEIHAARTGIRGANDLVWVGRSANYAAKLSNLEVGGKSTWITGDVYDLLSKQSKESADGKDMWEKYTWTEMNNIRIYGSSWTWGL